MTTYHFLKKKVNCFNIDIEKLLESPRPFFSKIEQDRAPPAQAGFTGTAVAIAIR
jgi:hypothetical protein